MGTGGYKITDQGAMYFVSFAVVVCLPRLSHSRPPGSYGWAGVDAFTRKDGTDIVIESLK